MTLTFPIFNISDLKQTLLATFSRPVAPTAQAISEYDDVLAERVFLRELMFHNAEAIQSDLGLMEMMTQYPRHF